MPSGSPAHRAPRFVFNALANNWGGAGWTLGASDSEAKLLKKFGGFVEGQYYFSNQWFLNALYAVSKAYGVNRSVFYNGGGIYPGGGFNDLNLVNGNEPQTIQQFSATLWYRPIQAIKFGLQYSYLAANYYQSITNPLALILSRLVVVIPPALVTVTGWSSSGSSTSNLKIG